MEDNKKIISRAEISTLSDSDSDSSSDDRADVVIEKSQVESTNSSCQFSEIIPISSTEPAAKRLRFETQAEFFSFMNDDIAIDNKKHEDSMKADDSVVVTSPAIATTSRNQERSQQQSRNQGRMEPQEDDKDDSIIVLDPGPTIIASPKRLRTVIIDGNHVAREHGRQNKTYSCKGIKICIDYFLRKGHTRVTAMVPRFRRYGSDSTNEVPTTDANLLEDLYSKKLVTFTPSRQLDGKTIVCDPNRLIVDLASRTDGVIVSNNNFRKLMRENEDFRRTIRERLLMYSFSGDIFAVPNDPMGRNGPTLDEFLSLPETEDNP